MRKTIALIICIIFAPMISMTVADGATSSVTFEWSYPVASEATITSYEIYDKDNVLRMSAITKTARSVDYTITHDGITCDAFYMQAVDTTNPANIVRSGNSNIAIWCPGQRVITIPGGFTGKKK